MEFRSLFIYHPLILITKVIYIVCHLKKKEIRLTITKKLAQKLSNRQKNVRKLKTSKKPAQVAARVLGGDPLPTCFPKQ